jgi:hypothetical protein
MSNLEYGDKFVTLCTIKFHEKSEKIFSSHYTQIRYKTATIEHPYIMAPSELQDCVNDKKEKVVTVHLKVLSQPLYEQMKIRNHQESDKVSPECNSETPLPCHSMAKNMLSFTYQASGQLPGPAQQLWDV